MDIIEIRRENLRRWVAEHGTPAKEKSMFSQLKSTGSFGEKVARRLEDQYKMGDRYLDNAHATPSSGVQQAINVMREDAEQAVGPEQATQLQRLNADEARMLEAYRLTPTIGKDSVKRMLESIPKIELPDQVQSPRKS